MKGLLKKVKKSRKWKIILISIVVVLAAIFSYYLLLEKQPKGERQRKWVIDGGVIGGVIDIGKGRVKVVSEEGKNTVFIENRSLDSKKITIGKNSDFYIKNLDRVKYTIEFSGGKSAILYYNQSYHLVFATKGRYPYTVEGQKAVLRGTVSVE